MTSPIPTSRRPRPRGQGGQSLIQVMITVAAAGVVMMTFMAMSSGQQKQSQLLREKLGRLDLQRVLTNTLQDGSVCAYLVANTASTAFDPTTLNAAGNHVFLTLTTLPARAAPDAAAVVKADNATPASPITDQLVVQSLTIDDLRCDPAPCTAGSDNFLANFTVQFDASRLQMALRPLKFPVTLQSTGTLGNQVIASCRGQAVLGTETVTSTVETCGSDPTNAGCPGYPVNSIAECSPGYQVTGCGYTLSTWAPRPPDPMSHTTSPDRVQQHPTLNGCLTYAGGAPGCGVCFRAQAYCIQIQ